MTISINNICNIVTATPCRSLTTFLLVDDLSVGTFTGQRKYKVQEQKNVSHNNWNGSFGGTEF